MSYIWESNFVLYKEYFGEYYFDHLDAQSRKNKIINILLMRENKKNNTNKNIWQKNKTKYHKQQGKFWKIRIN